MQQVDNGLPPMSWKQKMAGAAGAATAPHA
jgi:hypothetical protein